ncbi:hypothetical protein CHS0354_040265 [Potamilus streckersoni]|uniref:Arrestin C-terminal-like domain-containing protein n=1 Tax=Potamilus streckersoni TaxID=2493646 RepID=A0AAE0VPL9_9BIVA|nr:hypothetical protein CHS0354_040265 [Potamilus streckersoni]
MSSRKVCCSSVELKMTTVFHATHKSLTKTKQICKLKRGPIGRGDTDIWNGELFQVPPLPPSYLIGCDIIDVRYILEVLYSVRNSFT